MNELIQKIKESACPKIDWEARYYAELNNGEKERWMDEWFDKFAQLLIRECVGVMYDNAIERKVPPDINQTPTYYAIAVLEHFGARRMKVYLGIEVFYNGCDQRETVSKVFDDEAKALVWRDDFKNTVEQWREYREVDVE